KRAAASKEAAVEHPSPAIERHEGDVVDPRKGDGSSKQNSVDNHSSAVDLSGNETSQHDSSMSINFTDVDQLHSETVDHHGVRLVRDKGKQLQDNVFLATDQDEAVQSLSTPPFKIRKMDGMTASSFGVPSTPSPSSGTSSTTHVVNYGTPSGSLAPAITRSTPSASSALPITSVHYGTPNPSAASAVPSTSSSVHYGTPTSGIAPAVPMSNESVMAAALQAVQKMPLVGVEHFAPTPEIQR
ncbi:hypothetical protein HDU96_003178, partial [Phlyctochytrium bullatum]